MVDKLRLLWQNRKRVNRVVDRILTFFFLFCGLGVLWILLQVTTFSTFKVPSGSMEPMLLAGDYITVNKWITGARIFNLRKALNGADVDVYRLPGLGKIKRNDVLVFNYPYPKKRIAYRWM